MDKLRLKVLTHLDQSLVTYVLDGLQNGFCVGFNPASVSLKSAKQNMPSASLQPSVIDDYISTELAKGRVAGPSLPPLTLTSAIFESSPKNTSQANGT